MEKDDQIEAIRIVAIDYIEGWYSGDTERIGRSFHPDFVKRKVFVEPRTGRDVLNHLSATMMLEMTRAGGGKNIPTEQQHNTFTLLDIASTCASVKVESAEYIDYLHLARLNGRWMIVNVLWERRLEAMI